MYQSDAVLRFLKLHQERATWSADVCHAKCKARRISYVKVTLRYNSM